MNGLYKLVVPLLALTTALQVQQHNAPKCSREFLKSLSSASIEIKTQADITLYGDQDEEDEINDAKHCLQPLQEARLLDNVLPTREIFVTGNRNPSDPFIRFLAVLTQLEKLHWNADVLPSKRLLDNFERLHPTASLHLNLISWSFPSTELPGSLAYRSSLQSINAVIEYGGDDEPEHMRGLEELLYLAPNVTSLELDVHHNGGCLRSGGQPYAFDFTHPQRMRFPPLKILKLKGYQLEAISNGDAETEEACRTGVEDDMFRKMKTVWVSAKLLWREIAQPHKHRMGVDFEDRMYLLEKTCPTRKEQRRSNLEKWLERMDWSSIETLVVDSAAKDVLVRLMPRELWIDKLQLWNETSRNEHCIECGLPSAQISVPDYEVQSSARHEEL